MTRLRRMQLEAERRVAERKRERLIWLTLATATLLTFAVFAAWLASTWRG
jgi:hypothetical protein